MPIRDYRAATTAPGLAPTRELSLERVSNTSGLRALGNAVFDAGAVIEEARQQVEINDARLKLTEGLGAINADLTADTDFKTMRGRYGERITALSEEVLGSVATPRVKNALSLEMARARVATEANVFSREQGLMGAHARATVMRTVRTAASAIPTAGSDEEAGSIYKGANDAIDGLVAADVIGADEAEAMRLKLDTEVSTALVLDAINGDPAAAAAALDQPGAYGLEEVDRQQYLAAAKRQAEADAAQGASKLEREVDTARRVLMTGGTLDREDQAALLGRVAGTDFEAPLTDAIKASGELGGFAAATPQERKARIAELKDKGVKLGDAAIGGAYISTLEQMDAAATEAMAKSSVQYAVDLGLKGAAPLDPGNPDSWASRIAVSDFMVKKYGAKPDLLTPAERTKFKEVAKAGSVEDQLALVTSIIGNAGDRSEAVFGELDGINPVVRQAGTLVLETGEAEVATTILRGQKAIEAGNELYVASADAVSLFETGLDSAYRSKPGMRGDLIASVKAYYAAEAPGRVTVDDIEGQVAIMNEGMQRILGGEIVRGEQFGGIQPVNDTPVRLPRGMTGAGVEDILSRSPVDAWRAASLSGNLPHEGDKEIDLTERGVVLEWVKGSVYRVGVQSNRGGVEFYQDPGVDNGFFYVDLSKLAAGTPDE